ncbi:hypothetical protein [Nocardia sp. CC201C]|uniref:hypothetical protein n=1 Tax=Nocardia sp. CC201C TaxID=3044575 RepID=UPI0024A82D46|nr:hypothetical protein [Nocardia sp. CC201C]
MCEPGGRLHILALSNREPGIGPRIGDDIIRESFSDGWELEELSPSRYLGRVTEPVAAEAAGLEVRDGRVEVAARLARFRRR